MKNASNFLYFRLFICVFNETPPKTQIPVVAKQTIYRLGIRNTLSCTELAFYQIHHKRVFAKKGISIPKKENTPTDCIFSLFGKSSISHIFVKFNTKLNLQ